MADFTQIIQEINNDITTNGVGAITGAKLNEVLRDMIAAVNAEKQDPLTIDATPTEGSTNPVQSGGVYEALEHKPTIFFTPDIMNVPQTILNKVKVCDVIQYGDDAVTEVTVAVKDEQSDIVILVYNDGMNVGGFQYQNGICIDAISFGLADMANKVSGATNGNLAGLAANGDLTDSGIAASDVATTSDLAGKQDTISDLATIRSGAALGATSVQSSEKGAASGVATLDSGGKVPQSQLPSYVDDVLEYANLASFPATGESGKIYVALDTNKTYRWSGSAYVEISQSLALGETSSTAFAGDRGKAIEDKIPSTASSSNKLATASDVNGKLSAPSTAGTSGQVLTSDGQGGQSWQTPSGGGGTATDVQVNGTSITSNNVANIVTNTAYNASSNKIATMSDLPSVPVTDVTVGGTSVVSSGTAVIPAIPDVTGKADKVSNATSGNFASLDSNGNLADSGHKHSDYLTSHQDISGKEDKTNKVTSLSSSSTDTQYPSAKVVYDQLATKQATLVSGTNIKTINSTSLLGSGDLALALQSQGISSITSQQDGSIVFTFANGDTTTVDLNHTHPNYYKKTAETTQPSGGMLPDVTYKLGTLTGATTFLFAAAVSGNLNHYYFVFTSGSTAVVPTWPSAITSWDGNCVDSTTHLPVIAASKTYEVSVIDGNAFIKEW